MAGHSGHPWYPIAGQYGHEFYNGESGVLEIAPPFNDTAFDPAMVRPMFPTEGEVQAFPFPTQPIVIPRRTREELQHANGTAVDCRIGVSASFADKRYTFERAVTGYATVNQIDDKPNATRNNVLEALPSIIGNAPVGGVVCGLKIEWGSDGMSFTAVMNQLPGQTTRVPLVGARLRLSGTLFPKFYPFDDVSVPGTRFYLNPGEPPGTASQLTNDRFSRPMTNDVLLVDGPNLISQGFGNASVQFRGNLAEGQVSPDTLSKVTRRFYGSIPAGAANAVQVICPIPENCTDVMLIGGGIPPGLNFTQRPVVAAIQFAGYGAAFTELGPFNQGIIVPLIDGAADIIIRSAVALAVETQFELVFFCSM